MLQEVVLYLCTKWAQGGGWGGGESEKWGWGGIRREEVGTLIGFNLIIICMHEY